MSITTTKKFEQWVSVPLKECKLRDVPGVGGVAETKLKDANIDDACKLIGHFRETKSRPPSALSRRSLDEALSLGGRHANTSCPEWLHSTVKFPEHERRRVSD